LSKIIESIVLFTVKPYGILRNNMMYGKTFLRLKNYEKAKEYLQKAVDFEPKRPEDEEVYIKVLVFWGS